MVVDFLNELKEELEMKKIPDSTIKKQILDSTAKTKIISVNYFKNGSKSYAKNQPELNKDIKKYLNNSS